MFYKSVLFAAKQFVATRSPQSQLHIYLCLAPETKTKLGNFIDSWFPRSIKITDSKPGSEKDIVSQIDPLSVCFLFNENTLCLPEGLILGFDALNQTSLGTYLLMVDDSTAETQATDIRVLAQRHWKSLSGFPFVPQAMACRALTLSSDWDKLYSVEQALLRLVMNRTLLTAIPALAMNTALPMPLAVPWQKVIELVQGQN